MTGHGRRAVATGQLWSTLSGARSSTCCRTALPRDFAAPAQGAAPGRSSRDPSSAIRDSLDARDTRWRLPSVEGVAQQRQRPPGVVAPVAVKAAVLSGRRPLGGLYGMKAVQKRVKDEGSSGTATTCAATWRTPAVRQLTTVSATAPGLPISTSRAEGCVDEIADAQMAKKQRMRWSPQGAHRVAVVHAAVLDGRLRRPLDRPLAASSATFFPLLLSAVPTPGTL